MTPLAKICDSAWVEAAAMRYGQSVHDMQDIAQIAAIKYWMQRRQGTIRHDSAYFTQVLRRTIIDEARSFVRRPTSREIMDYDKPVTCGKSVNPTDTCERVAERIDLDAMIGRLPQKQRDVVLRLRNGESVNDIARADGVAEQVVRQRKSRAIQTLRQDFGRCDAGVGR